MNRSALIVGAGAGLSSSLALQCANLGMDVALAARNIDKLEDLSIKDKGGIYFAKFPLLPFSSTDIRTKMSQKKSIENLVTPEVSDFIKKTASYTSDGHKI